ncbi:MAG: VWA domain-containing protein [Planctomycetota bacterium]|nr:VWA domain-containing protein [Planctomycetota bacterium]
MRFRYSKWEESAEDRRRRFENLLRLYRELLLRTDGDAEEALRLLEMYGKRFGLFSAQYTIDDFKKDLERAGEIERRGGIFRLTHKGERGIRRSSLMQIFNTLRKGDRGFHATPHEGTGGERMTETRPFQFGDDPEGIDYLSSIRNTLKRGEIDDIRMIEKDFEVFETDHHTSVATVLMLDISHSMVLYGEDRITPAKKVALALTELITTDFPKDALNVITFGDFAEEIPREKLPYVKVGPFHTNTKHGLQMAQKILLSRKGKNKQIFMITDGKPSAIYEDGGLYINTFGLDRKIVNQTLNEAARCRRKGIVITTFMVASDPYLVDFIDHFTRINRGRAYFTSPDHLGGALLVEYVRNKRRRVR